MKKQTLGEMIASLRKEHGMTQLELAEKMGVTDKAVSKWERNLSCPDINSLPKLAVLFDISVDELMQVKTETPHKGSQEALRAFAPLALKSVALAMGVAVTVLSFLNALDLHTGLSMLGLGLVCLALALLQRGSS